MVAGLVGDCPGSFDFQCRLVVLERTVSTCHPLYRKPLLFAGILADPLLLYPAFPIILSQENIDVA